MTTATLNVPEDTRTAIVELARTGEILHRDGSTIVVAVKDAGNGPAIDVRELLPAREGYVPRSVKKQAVPSRGPIFTRKGWWLEPHAAEALMDAIAQALIIAEEVRADG